MEVEFFIYVVNFMLKIAFDMVWKDFSITFFLNSVTILLGGG